MQVAMEKLKIYKFLEPVPKANLSLDKIQVST